MAEISRAVLFGKLNPLAYKAIESATVFCKLRGNPYVELVHWLNQILQLQDSDLHRIVRHFGLDPARLARDFTAALDRLPRGATAISDFSPHVVEATERGLGLRHADVRRVAGAHRASAVRGAAGRRRCATSLLGISREFAKIGGDALGETFAQIVAGSPEERHGRLRRLATGRGAAGRGQRGHGARADGQAGGAEALLDRPDREGAQGRDRPDRRPRRGNPPDHRHPDAPPAEQPDPHRRGRRRQDGGGRGLRAAHRAGRRAAAAAGT